MAHSTRFSFPELPEKSGPGWSLWWRYVMSLLCVAVTLACTVATNAVAAALSPGMITGWGDDTSKQSTVPAGLTDVKAIAAGRFHSLALKNDGTVVLWGNDLNGKIAVPGLLQAIPSLASCPRSTTPMSSTWTRPVAPIPSDG